MSGADPLVGTRVREYEILEVLGKGGMGAVYRARHVYLDEDRAIKVIKSDRTADPSFVDRFIREARLLSKLRSRHLVQVFEFGTLGEHTFFMVMELLAGESVLERLRTHGRLSVEDSIRIVREAALGLDAAHRKGIVHRDISPDNLFLVTDEQGDEVTKVIDFGIAKPLFETVPSGTATNVFIGKFEYCSPEQCGALQEGETIDARADVYSLAITLYNMLTGRLPFRSTSPHGYLIKHATEAPPPPSQFVPPDTIPEGLERVVMKALGKDRSTRQSSMAELVAELDAVEISSPVQAGATIDRPAATPEHRTGDVAIGELFASRYVIEAKIGEGGMGAVYRASDTILEVPVALKVISRKVVPDRRTLDRLKREVILARKVAHPNVCRIHDIGESGGFHYVSMELLKGQDLAHLLSTSGRFTLAHGLPLARQLLEALREAHRVGVVHRDLKPQNIMVDPRGHLSIMDFGISVSNEVNRITQTGMVVGTPHYMSPEQVLGRKVDSRADLYSVGVILFRMFTGSLPFEGRTPTEVLVAHTEAPPPRPSSRVPALPSALDEVVLKSLAKSPGDRYADAAAMLEALDSLAPLAGAEDVTGATMADVAPEGGATSGAQGDRDVGRRRPDLRTVGTVVAASIAVAGLALLASRTVLRAPNGVRPTAAALAVTGSPALSQEGPAQQPATPLPVSINAVPWARVRIAAEPGSPQVATPAGDDAVTPCFLALPEGSYIVGFENGGLSTPLQERISVRAGASNVFTFRMPGYDADKTVAAVLGPTP
jgi:serine/threonine protein kinase